MRRQLERGLTLVEVLVVLALMGVLLVVLLPVFSACRERSAEASCAANLRHLGQALALYVTDSDEVFPPVLDRPLVLHRAHSNRIWSNLLAGYLGGQIPRCPLAEYPGRLAKVTDGTRRSGYAYNEFLNSAVVSGHVETLSGRLDAGIRYPALTVALADARVGIAALKTPDTGTTEIRGVYSFRLLSDILTQQVGARRHREGANYSFVDGRVAWLTPDRFSSMAENDGTRPNFHP